MACRTKTHCSARLNASLSVFERFWAASTGRKGAARERRFAFHVPLYRIDWRQSEIQGIVCTFNAVN